MGKKREKVKILFCGENSQDVTGSMTLVEYNGEKVLLDCGYYQCSNKLKQYQVNNRNLKFKVKDIDNIIISHLNLDHYGLLPILYKRGCKAKIFMMKGGRDFLKIAFEDSLKINISDSIYLSKLTNKTVLPLFDEKDIELVLNNIIECDYNTEYPINTYMNFSFHSSYHIMQSAYIDLHVSDKNYKKRILYGCDLGNTTINKPFMKEFDDFNGYYDVCIMESTYGNNKKSCTQKQRDKDIEKIGTIVRETCIENKSVLCIPTFAVMRMEEILYELYMIFKDDKTFDIPILIDSPLSIKVIDIFHNLIPKEQIDIWNEIRNWSNIKFINTWDESESARRNQSGKIVLCASGFCEAGRSRDWLKSILGDNKSTVVFCGYSDDTSLASKIKEGKSKYVEIDKEKVNNKAKICVLNSFSSHIQCQSMLDVYSRINTKDIYLVHSDMDNRLKFAEELNKECERQNNSKVWVAYKDLEIEL